MSTLSGAHPILSTSNLVQPDRDVFLRYARSAHEGGPIVDELESRLGEFHTVEHCISLCNGFWALVVTMRLLAVAARTDALMPSLTYRRMADVAAWAGLRPRFCEVERETLACSAATMRAALTPEVGVLLGVHPIVGCCDVIALEKLAQEEGLPLLFDSVESVFEHVDTGKVGRFGNAECFSLHASKLLNGFEGGYVTTRDETLAGELRRVRDEMGLRLEPFHAAMALASLDDLNEQVVRNRVRYALYQAGLAGIGGIRLVAFDESTRTSYKNIVIELMAEWPLTREETVDRLNRQGILARAYYYPPLHAKPMAYPYVPAVLPISIELSMRYILLPCGHHVDPAGIALVIAALNGLSP